MKLYITFSSKQKLYLVLHPIMQQEQQYSKVVSLIAVDVVLNPAYTVSKFIFCLLNWVLSA